MACVLRQTPCKAVLRSGPLTAAAPSDTPCKQRSYSTGKTCLQICTYLKQYSTADLGRASVAPRRLGELCGRQTSQGSRSRVLSSPPGMSLLGRGVTAADCDSTHRIDDPEPVRASDRRIRAALGHPSGFCGRLARRSGSADERRTRGSTGEAVLAAPCASNCVCIAAQAGLEPCPRPGRSAFCCEGRVVLAPRLDTDPSRPTVWAVGR